MTRQRLVNSLTTSDKGLAKTQILLEASLGIILNGSATVQVSNRPQFVYCRIRDNTSEVVQAFNDQVFPQYDLPVILVRQKTRYIVQGRDTLRYANWGNNQPFLPLHGWTHSLDDQGVGADIAFVYERQMVPMLVSPNGSAGNNNVLINRYLIRNPNNTWNVIGNTGTINLLQYAPPTINQAVMVLVGLDTYTGNPFYLVGSGSYFSSSITGTGQIAQYIPSSPDPSRYIADSAVRLINGQLNILWPNIYDVRQFIHVLPTGSGGGGGLSSLPIQNFGVPLGTATTLNFHGAENTTISGSVADINIYGVGGGGGNYGIFGENQGVPLVTGTIFNVNGTRLVLSSSGTTLILSNSPDPLDNIGLYGINQGVGLGTGTSLSVTGSGLNMTLVGNILTLNLTGAYPIGPAGGDLTGSYPNPKLSPTDFSFGTGTGPRLPAAGTNHYYFDTTNLQLWQDESTQSGPQWVLISSMQYGNLANVPPVQLGIYGLANGIPLGTGTSLDFGNYLTASISGTRIRINNANPASGTYVGVIGTGSYLGSFPTLDFEGNNVSVTSSGTIARIFITGSTGGSSSLGIIGTGSYLGTFSTLDFEGPAASLTTSGSYARIFITGTIPARHLITSNINYYVSPSGSDNNNGLTTGTPFFTPQYAWNVATQQDLGLFNVIINLADGTYNSGVTGSGWIGEGSITFNGNSVFPSNVVVSPSISDCFANFGVIPSVLIIKNLQMQTPTGTAYSNYCINNNGVGTIEFSNTVFGLCGALSHIASTGAGANVTVIGNYSIINQALYSHILVNQGGIFLYLGGITTTISNTPKLSSGFLYCTREGVVIINPGVSFSGTISGGKFYADAGALIDDLTGGAFGTVLPGTFYTLIYPAAYNTITQPSPSASVGVAAPAGSSSSAHNICMGMGLTLTINRTGQVLLSFCGSMANSTLADSAVAKIVYGTGNAPSNATIDTSASGWIATLSQPIATLKQPVAADKIPFSLTTILSGLTIGVKFWFDIGLSVITGGTATVVDVSGNVVEI